MDYTIITLDNGRAGKDFAERLKKLFGTPIIEEERNGLFIVWEDLDMEKNHNILDLADTHSNVILSVSYDSERPDEGE